MDDGDDRERPSIDPVDDKVRKDYPEAQLLAERQIPTSMALSRCSDQRAKRRTERRHYAASYPNPRLLEQMISNLPYVLLRFSG